MEYCACILSHVQLFVTLQGSFVHRILQTRILEWVAISFFTGFPNSGIKPRSLESSAFTGRFFTIESSGNQYSAIAEDKICHLQQHGWT